MASSTTGVKRSRPEAVPAVSVLPLAVHNPLQIPKRVRRLSDSDALDLPTILKSDRNGFAKYPARAAFLQSFNIPDQAILGLLQGLGSDFRSFLSIIDLNLFQANILAVINDFSSRGVSMTTLNIRGHSFCMTAKEGALASFSSFYGHLRWPCDVATYVGTRVFQGEDRMSINILSGGGVRDVLMTEWCRSYYTDCSAPPPQLIVLTSGSGRVFLIPFLP